MQSIPCSLGFKDGIPDAVGPFYCSRHQCWHVGRNYQYAIGTDEASAKRRMLWDNPSDVIARDSAMLRKPTVSMTCRHLDPNKISNEEAVGMEEIAKALETGCKGCAGYTTMRRCHGGGGVQGITTINYCSNRCVDRFDPLPIGEAALRAMPSPTIYPEGRCIILCGGGDYESSLWVTSKLIRKFDPDIPIILFHGHQEKLNYEAFRHVEIRKAPQDIVSGWPMKSYALLKAPVNRVLFLDADFHPTESIARHFEAPSGVICANSVWNAIEWDKYHLTPDDRNPLDGGFWMIDKNRHPKLTWVYYYFNTVRHQDTYQWGVGDQDQLRAALRFCEINYDSIGQAEMIGRAIVYRGVGVHRYNDKLRQRGSKMREYSRRPVPDPRLPNDSETFKLLYEYEKLYLNKS